MLLPHHLQELLNSCISQALIDLNFWSIEDSQEIDRLLNRNSKLRWKHTFNCAGWAVKGINPIDNTECWESVQFKPDVPRVNNEGKIIKYETAVDSRIAPLFLEMPDRAFWQKVFNSLDPILITEGAKKAGCGLTAGYPTVSIPGVWNGQNKGRLHYFLKHFTQPGRRFYLAFDSDLLTKLPVQQALHQLSRLLLETGCNVSVVQIPSGESGKTGLDDYCAQFGLSSLTKLIEDATTFEEWKNALIDARPALTKRQKQIAKLEKIFANRVKLLVRGNQILVDGKPYNADYGYLDIEKKYGIGAGVQFLNNVIQWLASANPYDPVKDWIEELYDRWGDTTAPLMEGIASRYLGTDNPMYDIYLKKVLLAAIDRVYNPGCKFETACVLQGPQGIGKSTFWRILGGKWFDDTMRDTSNDELMKLHTCWIHEWGEIDRVTNKKEASEIKQFLSVQNDKFRPPYGRQVVENPRRFIIVGTTNSPEFLVDVTGDRRFWVIPVCNKIDLTRLKMDVEKLWAGAYSLWLTGTEKTYLTPEEEALREEINSQYRIDDPWEEPIANFLQGKQEVKVTQILTDCLGFTVDRFDRRIQLRVTAILSQMGWEKTQTRSGKVWRPKNFKKTEIYGSHGSHTDKTQSRSQLQRDPSINSHGSPMGHMGHSPLGNPPPVSPVPHKVDKNRALKIGDIVTIANIFQFNQAINQLPVYKRPPEVVNTYHWQITNLSGDSATIKLLSSQTGCSVTVPLSAIAYIELTLDSTTNPKESSHEE